MLDVFVPAPDSPLRVIVIRGSALVGSPAAKADQITIDFEGNLYDAENLQRFAQRVAAAAGRHASRYPTVARMTVPGDELVKVAEWDADAGRVHVLDAPPLARWLDVQRIDPRELTLS